jgi:hypothetical protein
MIRKAPQHVNFQSTSRQVQLEGRDALGLYARELGGNLYEMKACCDDLANLLQS